MAQGALDGVRIVDLSFGVAGPMTTMTLSDQGAEVILVEPPGGHPFRDYGGYVVWDRGKKSVVLDLKAPGDRGKLLELLATADVLVESFAPGSMETLGLGYQQIKSQFPALVYCSITGYGRNNRSEQRPDIDLLVQARSGMQWEQPGWREGAIALFLPLPSLATSYLAESGIAAALYVREVTGKGQWVETSLYQGALCFTTLRRGWTENPPSQPGPPNRWNPQPNIFECADGKWVHSMHAAGGRGKDRSIIWQVLGIEPMALRPPPDLEGAAAHEAQLRAAFKKHPRQYILDGFWNNEIAIQAVQAPHEALTDPQMIHNGMVVDILDPVEGPTTQAGLFFKLHGVPGKAQGPAPRVGEHTQQVLGSLNGGGSAKPAGTARRPLENALQGVKVLDFGDMFAGPFGPAILGDLGAEVIKLEQTEGNQMRSEGPGFNNCQRSKRGIAVDLKKPGGQEIAHRLMKEADVIHHNMRSGVAERLGIDYETARKLNPSVIYCHNTSYGSSGPRANWPGTDQIGQSFGGVEYEQGGEGNPPNWVNFGMCDHGAAMQSVVAVILALYWREKTGKGQFIDTCIINCATYYNSDVWIGPKGPFQRTRLDKKQMGRGPLYRLYETREGWLAIACLEEKAWNALSVSVGGQDLARDPRFSTPADRKRNAAALAEVLEPAFLQKSAEEWFTVLDQAGVPCEISDKKAIESWLTDPELVRNGLVSEYVHPNLGRMRQYGDLIHFSETPGRIFRPPPRIGEHTKEILSELGYTEEETAKLKEAGTIIWPAESGQPAVAMAT